MATRTSLSPQQLTRMATDLRLACMRISRRIRYESRHTGAPHQFSVLCRLEEVPRTPGELAEIERVAKPSMTRTVAALVERGLVLRQADPTDGRQVIVSLTPEGRAASAAYLDRPENQVAQLPPEDQEVLAKATVLLAKVAAQ